LIARLAPRGAGAGLAGAAVFAARLEGGRAAIRARISTEGLEPVLVELMDALLPGGDESLGTGPDAEMLLDAARETGGDLQRFLRRLDLSPLESEGGARSEKVRLLTFHAAKGLEFPVVFIAGAEEGITPLAGSHADSPAADPDEERRLFYVAVTRAMDELYISYCSHRMIFGKAMDMMPSRYLSYIPDTFRETVAPTHGRSRPARDAKRDTSQLPLF
jgi:DNA helicase II / ATP-dependent DNA helicase PcrA